MEKLIVSGMEFVSGIGCYEAEKIIGSKFIVDLEITANCSKAAETDNLYDAINYVNVYKLVAKEMAIQCNLIENAAQRILNQVVNYSANIYDVRVRLSKINPVIGGKLEKVTIEMFTKNED